MEAIEEYAFFNCTGLKNIVFPASLKSISDNAFLGCDSLETIEFGGDLVESAELSFHNCTKLVSATVPLRLVQSLPRNTRQIVILSGPELIPYEFEENLPLFRGGSFGSLVERISIPDSVKTIEDNAFAALCSLEEILLPDSIESIGNNAFGYCKKLRRIVVRRKKCAY